MGICAHKMAYFWMSPIYFLTNFHSAIWNSLVPDSRSNQNNSDSVHISMFKSFNKGGVFKYTKVLGYYHSPSLSPLKQRPLWKAPCIAWAVVYKSEKEAANSPNETCACCCSAARSRQGSAKLFEIPRLILFSHIVCFATSSVLIEILFHTTVSIRKRAHHGHQRVTMGLNHLWERVSWTSQVSYEILRSSFERKFDKTNCIS